MSVTYLYNRMAVLQVGIPGKEGKDFTGLRINFSIEKSSESNPNQAKIQVFNLSVPSRSFVEQKKLVLVLKVGYHPPGFDPLIETLVQGDVKKVTNEQKGPDWITTFEIGDGEVALQEKTFDKTFEKGISLKKAIAEVQGSLNLPSGAISGIKDKIFGSGLTLSGGSKQLLDQLTKEGDTEWSVQDGEVQILSPTGFTADEAILLSPQTGLINSPVKREVGIETISLLIPKLRPGRRIKVESASVTGVYRIRKVTFTGDTHEGDWQAKVEAV